MKPAAPPSPPSQRGRPKPGTRKRVHAELRPGLIKARLEALDLRAAGYSYRAIAAKQGISKRGAFKRVERAFRLALSERVEEMRQLEGLRLDALFRPQYEKATKLGDREAVETCLRIMARRARLFGLDAPTKTEANTTPAPGLGSDLDIPVGMPIEEVRTMFANLLRWEANPQKKARLEELLWAIGGGPKPTPNGASLS